MGAPKALNPSLQPVNYHVAMLNSDDGWKLTQPPVAQLREPWSKHLEPGHSWVFVCRKAFDPTSAQEWFKDARTNRKCTHTVHGKPLMVFGLDTCGQ